MTVSHLDFLPTQDCPPMNPILQHIQIDIHLPAGQSRLLAHTHGQAQVNAVADLRISDGEEGVIIPKKLSDIKQREREREREREKGEKKGQNKYLKRK